MSHYAKIVNGKVAEIIVADAEFFKTFIDSTPGAWIQTSYNTHSNKNLITNLPLRGNYAGIGYTYDETNDVFYAPQPFLSWTLDANWLWQPPIEMPIDGENYVWDEPTKTWVKA